MGSTEPPKSALSRIWHKIGLGRRWKRCRELTRAFGWRGAGRFCLYRRWSMPSSALLEFRVQGATHPLFARPQTSDLSVLGQIFSDREYAGLDGQRDVTLIIDCGANVGYSSAWFLSQFPNCRLIAIEPDAGNFAMLSRNLAPYGDRATLIHSGVWSTTAGLKMQEQAYGDGRNWSRQVRPCEAGETADFQAIEIGSLLHESSPERISILKIDVEGAEAEVFSENYEGWLSLVDTIAIELHDDSMFGNGSAVFHRAIAGQDFRVSRSHELTICQR